MPNSLAESNVRRPRAAVAEPGYVPQAAAESPGHGSTRTLGLLLPDLTADFFWPLLRGVTLSATDAGYSLLLAIRNANEHGGAPVLPVGRHNTDGLIIFDMSVDETELRQLDAAGIPLALLYRSAPAGTAIPSISIENQHGARRIVDHLIEAHGCRRIAFLAAPAGNEDGMWRERGYRESLAAHGIAFDPALVGPGAFSEQTARATIEGWLNAGLAFDAVFSSDDDAARGALFALTQAGRRVPRDLAVVGFDDSPLSSMLNPALTTVRAPTAQVGRVAVEQIMRIIRTGQCAPVTRLPTELVIRQSCGCP